MLPVDVNVSRVLRRDRLHVFARCGTGADGPRERRSALARVPCCDACPLEVTCPSRGIRDEPHGGAGPLRRLLPQRRARFGSSAKPVARSRRAVRALECGPVVVVTARRPAGPWTSVSDELTLAQASLDDNWGMATVLVVDDEPIVREVVVRYLEREGHTTLEAAHGDRARELLEQQRPDVVLDVMLPGTDGLELCRWIRARSDLPVIMLTARGEERRDRRARARCRRLRDQHLRRASSRHVCEPCSAGRRRLTTPGATGLFAWSSTPGRAKPARPAPSSA